MAPDDKSRWLVTLPSDDRQAFLAALSPSERAELQHLWELWGRSEQRAPSGDWRLWLILAGRGFGKTRAGAEWIREIARDNPTARIALVGASLPEARAVMVEGESGILASSPAHRRPRFEASLRRISWDNGAQAFIYSAAEPESLRGPQHSHAWCDEIAKWENSGERAIQAWDNLQMGLRLGEHPQILATTTPRAVPLLRRLLANENDNDVVITRGSTYSNALNLPQRFISAMKKQFGDTTLGRQELNGEMLEEAEGALWTRAMLEKRRDAFTNEPMARVVVGVDPPASARGDECGIIVAGITHSGMGVVLADASVAKASPERWANAVAAAAQAWKAERVVAEANQGGSMVESVLRAADFQMPIRLVHASRGKSARAEPIAALYEAGRVHHVGVFAKLEDQLCGLMAGGAYEGPGRSPDRADAMVWALTELMLGNRGQARVRQF
jgi:phage terminase large subunit-like protein